MTDTVVAEGQVKFKDGKKWKSRWVVLGKPSPVADCLSLLVYKDRGERARGHRERVHLTLEGICGLEPGQGYDGAAYTLTLLCPGQSLALGFDTQEGLLAWDARLRYSLGEVHRFTVGVQPGTKLESGPASLHLCNDLLVLTRDLPPTVIGEWKLSDLRRYGAVPSGFVFEGGTRCGYWAGVFFLSCAEGEQISFLFDCIVRGISPSRAPHGLRPALPDPTANPSVSEERISQEASELERRLSVLSHRHSSTASTYSYSTSVAGDDHSSISSSSSSQSDTSYGNHLSLWAEPGRRLHPSSESLFAAPTTKGSPNPDDCLYAAVVGGSVIRPSSNQRHVRGLHDSGRQSSLDSGIGIATSSQSSYSGSFSSCSLDTASQGGGEEFGSQFSLHPPPAPPPPPPVPPPPLSPPLLGCTPDYSPVTPPPCSCPPSTDTSSPTAPKRQGEEYHVPSLLRLLYDTPRNLLHSQTLKDPLARAGIPEMGKDRRTGGGVGGQGLSDDPPNHPLHRAGGRCMSPIERPLSQGRERKAPPVDNSEHCSSIPATFRLPPLPGCPVCRGTQCNHCSDLNYISHEQWYSSQERGYLQGTSAALTRPSPSTPIPDQPSKQRDEERRRERGEGVPWSCSLEPLKAPPPGKVVLHRHNSPVSDLKSAHELTEAQRRGELRLEEYRSFFTPPPEGPSPSLKVRARSDSANYVNIPVSPVAKANASRETLYMELDLQGPAVASTPALSSTPTTARGGGSTRYAHIDIAATETAQRVGAEHAQGREDRLAELEQRRWGPQT
ncbi:protein Dok-7-like isoform X2 [Osmerus mordax]|uniref:protein Dok-7-like isoform X2 n=1 Tax=Osmerus mordax TaxID=8014 RepID=UPI00350F763E